MRSTGLHLGPGRRPPQGSEGSATANEGGRQEPRGGKGNGKEGNGKESGGKKGGGGKAWGGDGKAADAQRTELCIAFLQGHCRRGKSCAFVHDEKAVSAVKEVATEQRGDGGGRKGDQQTATSPQQGNSHPAANASESPARSQPMAGAIAAVEVVAPHAPRHILRGYAGHK